MTPHRASCGSGGLELGVRAAILAAVSEVVSLVELHDVRLVGSANFCDPRPLAAAFGTGSAGADVGAPLASQQFSASARCD